jgi:hypothetical protein
MRYADYDSIDMSGSGRLPLILYRACEQLGTSDGKVAFVTRPTLRP